MYLPKLFQIEDAALLGAFIRKYPFATVVGILHGQSEINHLPLMLSEDGTRLHGHIAKTNPIAQIASQGQPELTAIFHGPHGYITPSWYPSKKETGKVVPTWNYAVAHAHGQLKLINDSAWLLDNVSTLTNLHEPTYQSSWKVSDAPEEYIQMMLNSIVGIEISVTRLTGKFKLSQNRPAEDYAGVVAHLEQSPDQILQEMLSYMSNQK